MCNRTAISRPNASAPVNVVLEPPSLFSRYACAAMMTAIFGVWGKITLFNHSGNGTYDESMAPGIGSDLHSWKVPAFFTTSYIIALPILRMISKKYLSETVDVKCLLKETMVVYNGGQVLLNGWMVYRFIDALVNRGHPFIGDYYNVNSGAAFGVWIHYMDKYLEFFDTFFMVLRGRMDQVSFLHVYHHISITWAWWVAIRNWPGGDSYFGALLNSWVHVMMYSYYALSLLKFPCPWKRYITQAQLLQFTTVVVYTLCSAAIMYKKDMAIPKRAICFYVQTFEMVSLFYLFSLFYSKSYKKKQGKKSIPPPEAEVLEQSSIGSSDSSDGASSDSSDSSTGEFKKEL